MAHFAFWFLCTVNTTDTGDTLYRYVVILTSLDDLPAGVASAPPVRHRPYATNAPPAGHSRLCLSVRDADDGDVTVTHVRNISGLV